MKGVRGWQLFVSGAGSCYDSCKSFILPMLSYSLDNDIAIFSHFHRS